MAAPTYLEDGCAAEQDDMQPPPLLVIGLGCVVFIYQVSYRATHTSFSFPDRFGPDPPTHMTIHTIWHHVWSWCSSLGRIW